MTNKIAKRPVKKAAEFGEEDIRFAINSGAIPLAHLPECYIVRAEKNPYCTCGAENQAYEVIRLLIERAFQVLKPMGGKALNAGNDSKELQQGNPS